MGPTEQLSSIVPTLVDLVDGIDCRQLYHPTPCRQFTVHDVLGHMIALGGGFACAFRGEAAPAHEPMLQYGWVPRAEFRSAMADLLDAVRSPGAMERTITAPIGQMPGATFASFVAFDGLIHGWDLASATGQRYEVAPELVAAVDEFARSAITPGMRDGGSFAAEVVAPVGATPLEALVAFSGRCP